MAADHAQPDPLPTGVDAADRALNAIPVASPGNIEDSETVYAALRGRRKTAYPKENSVSANGMPCMII